LCFAVIGVAAAVAADGGTVASNLANPRGIDVGPGKRVFVVESATGAIDEIRKGETQTIATVPGAVDVAVSGEGKMYAVTGGPGEGAPPPPPESPLAKLVQIGHDGEAEVIADIGAYEAQHPDPDDLDMPPNPTETNPNGLALLPGHQFLVADAASNRLLLVSKDGEISTVARFRPELVAWTLPNPPAPFVPAEAVPTAVAVGPDGAYYVSELTGFPFTKGAARIWRIKPGTVDAVCDPAQIDPAGPCQSVATGFSSVIDLTFGRDGTMYVLEIAKNGLAGALVLGTEFPPIGALWAVNDGSRTAISDSLVAPGGVAVDNQGDIFVTTVTFGPPGGTVVNLGG
jgi:hypothetical protein